MLDSLCVVCVNMLFCTVRFHVVLYLRVLLLSVCGYRAWLYVEREMTLVCAVHACMYTYLASKMLDAFSITYRKRRVQGNPTNDSTFSSRLASCTAVGQGEVRVR